MDGFSNLKGIFDLTTSMATSKLEIAIKKLALATNAAGFAAAVKELGFDFKNVDDNDLVAIIEFTKRIEELL